MRIRFSKFLDQVSEFIARRRGLLPIIGVLLIGLNFALQIVHTGWIGDSNLFLHIGIILAIVGFLLASAL